MNKIINPLVVKIGNQFANAFCKIEIENGKLSIFGVIGPNRWGNTRGGCGQIYNELIDNEEKKYTKGWDGKLIEKFVEVWKEWHLNDLQAGCEHQRKLHWGEKEIVVNGKKKYSGWIYPKEHKEGVLGKKCPICGYEYGTAWLKKELPQEIIDFLLSLPESKKIPAWI